MQQRVSRPDRHCRGADRDVGHVATLADGDAQAASLTDRERVDPVVRADDDSVFIDDRARTPRDARAEEGFTLAALDEADVHALALVGRA